MAGRPKKPIAVQKLEGRVIKIEEPVQEPATASIPDWLPPAGKDFLAEHGARLRVEMGVKALDEPMMHAMAACWGNAVAAQRKVNEEGLVSPERDDPDIMRKNPHEAIMRAQISTAIMIMKQFGMSPEARLRLLRPVEKNDEDGLLDGSFRRADVQDWRKPGKVQ